MKKSNTSHTVDILFVLGLLAVFAISALLVIQIGATVYSNTAKTMEINYTNHTALDYIVEKVRTTNVAGDVEVISEGDISVLSLTGTDGSVTYIYATDGHLEEQYTSSAGAFDNPVGEQVMDVEALDMSIDGNMLEITITINGEEETAYVSLL